MYCDIPLLWFQYWYPLHSQVVAPDISHQFWFWFFAPHIRQTCGVESSMRLEHQLTCFQKSSGTARPFATWCPADKLICKEASTTSRQATPHACTVVLVWDGRSWISWRGSYCAKITFQRLSWHFQWLMATLPQSICGSCGTTWYSYVERPTWYVAGHVDFLGQHPDQDWIGWGDCRRAAEPFLRSIDLGNFNYRTVLRCFKSLQSRCYLSTDARLEIIQNSVLSLCRLSLKRCIVRLARPASLNSLRSCQPPATDRFRSLLAGVSLWIQTGIASIDVQAGLVGIKAWSARKTSNTRHPSRDMKTTEHDTCLVLSKSFRIS